MAQVMCYWEKQGGTQMCGCHCLNSALQGARFKSSELDAIARSLVGMQDAALNKAQPKLRHASLQSLAQTDNNDFGDRSGNYNVHVLEAALLAHRLGLQRLKGPSELRDGDAAIIVNDIGAYHWFTLRRVNGLWWDLNSLRAHPEQIDQLYPVLDGLIGRACNLFALRPLTDAEVRESTLIQGTSPLVKPGALAMKPLWPLPEPNARAGAGTARSMTLNDVSAAGGEGRYLTRHDIDMLSGRSGKSNAPAAAGGASWATAGAGQSLGGGAASLPAAASGVDDALVQAMLLSFRESALPAEPAAGEGVTIQVRNGPRKARRVFLEAATIQRVCQWALGSDCAVGASGIGSIVKLRLPPRGPTFEVHVCDGARVLKDGVDVSQLGLREAGLSGKMEQLMFA